jgi:ATPase subunit of ABC transporter with duplicated ATPase domains
MKKNTLLYLDADLVERAKKENVNISRLAEDALKEALKIAVPRTAREYLVRVLGDAGRELAFYGEAYLLPFQIESIKLENVGPFQDFEAKFRKGALNVIYGPCGSGKSTIIRSILFAFGKWHTYFSKSKNGKITLQLFPDQDSVKVTTNEENPLDAVKGYRCLIADDIFQRVPKSMISGLCEEMKKLGIQIIITTSIAPDLSKFPKDTNAIPLENSWR